MSALTINKVVCRVYGTLFLLLGVTSLLFGGLLIYSYVFSLPDRLPDWKLFRALASLDLKTEPFLGLGVASMVLAAIPIAVGVFACLRYVWAMLIGTLLWLVLYFPGPLLFFPGKASGFGAFEIISTLVFVLLTIVGASISLLSSPDATKHAR